MTTKTYTLVALCAAALAFTSACTSAASNIAAAGGNDADAYLSRYVAHKDHPAFRGHLTALRTMGPAFVSDLGTMADDLTINGQTFTGVRAMIVDLAAPMEAASDYEPMAIGAFLSDMGALNDDIGRADFDELLDIATTFFNVAGEGPDAVKGAMQAYAPEAIVNALNTALVQDSLEALPSSAGLNLLEEEASDEFVSSGSGFVDFFRAIPKAIEIAEKTQDERINTEKARLGTVKSHADATAEERNNACYNQQPTDKCDLAWNNKGGLSPRPCTKTWVCSCPNADDAGSCAWTRGPWG